MSYSKPKNSQKKEVNFHRTGTLNGKQQITCKILNENNKAAFTRVPCENSFRNYGYAII